MFRVTDHPINGVELKEQLRNDKAGAFVVFEGSVRNHNEGKRVSSLEYEIFKNLALKEAHKIIEEAKAKFEILDLVAVHRVGHMEVGESAVWIGVSSKHREAGFRACRYVIDEIKLRLPIWKKEYYLDTEAKWVNCQGCYNHAHIHYKEKNYYEKQLKLKSVGEAGQRKLGKSKVLVVGAGGLGCPALNYIASAGVGQITICDGDRLEISNLHRQVLYSHADIGEYKSVLAKKRLKELNPFIKVEALTHKIHLENAKELISRHDLILDCTDNFETKFLVHDTCFFLKKPLIQASIYQNEGQLQMFCFDNASACMRCIWPKVPNPGCIGNCTDTGVLGVVPGVLGTMQATEALKYLLGQKNQTASKTLLVDLLSWDIYSIKRAKSEACPLCGIQPTIKGLVKLNYGFADFEIDLSEIKDNNLSHYSFVDIRRPEERNVALPWEKFLASQPLTETSEFNLSEKNKFVMLVCAKGVRSRNLTKKLRSQGNNKVFSLIGGIPSVRQHWDRIQKGLECS